MPNLKVLPQGCCAPLTREPLKQTDAVDLAPLFKALGDPVRLRLLSLIACHDGGEACVDPQWVHVRGDHRDERGASRDAETRVVQPDDRDAAIRSMEAAASAGVERYVMVSWIGSRADHGVAADSSFYPYADAKWAADRHLSGSDLDWTILAPGSLTLEPATGRIALDPEGSGAVARADVAAVIAAAIADDSTIGRTIRFGGGGEPIGHAIAG